MPADAMVHLDDGRHRTLTEASHSTHGELAVRRGQQQFVGFVSVAVTVLDTQSQVESCALQHVARTTGMTRRPAANADGILALGLEIKQRVEGGNAVDARKRHFRLGGDVAQRLHGKIFVAVFFLRGFQDAKQGSRASPTTADYFIDEYLFFSGKTSSGECLHRHSYKGCARTKINVSIFNRSAPSLRAQQEVTRITGVPEWYVGSQPPALQRFMGPRAECRSLAGRAFRRASEREFIFWTWLAEACWGPSTSPSPLQSRYLASDGFSAGGEDEIFPTRLSSAFLCSSCTL